MRTLRDRRVRRRAAGVAAGLLLAALLGGGPGRAQAGGDSDRSFTLTVRGPDGTPLRRHALTVFVADEGPPSAGVRAGPSDDRGRVTVALPAGVRRLGVIAPGLGFGLTGSLEAGPAGAVTADVPPLCPFARLSGTVAPDLRLAGETVHLDVFSALGQARPPVLVDTRGRFTLDDVPPGEVRVVLSGVAGAPPGAGHDFSFSYRLAPGEQRRVTLTAPPLRPPRTFSPVRFTPGGPTRTITLRGTVTDDQGKPMVGAEVYAQVPRYSGFSGGGGGFGGGMRFGPPPALTTTTGADGGYVFSDVALVDPAYDTQITLAVAAAGHAPAVALAHVPPDGTSDMHTDLVVSTRHTALTVRVTGPDGKPAAGVTVHLKQEGDIPDLAGNRVLYSETPYPGMFSLHPPPAILGDLFTLSGATGPDGAARFVDLDPGLWDVTAGNGPLPAPEFRTQSLAGVAVRAGQGAVCTLALSPPPVPPTVRVLGPDGHPVPVQNATLEPGLSPTGTRVFPLDKPGTDPAGDVPVRVEAPLVLPGLWRVTANYRDGSSSWGYYGPTIPEPYNEAGALVALSPALPPPGLIVLHALHHVPGSLRVRLEDAQGRPARGAVLVSGSYTPDGAASVDAGGEVVFAGLPSGTYRLQGYLAGQPPPDAALTGRPVLLPQTVAVTGGQEAEIVLRPRPVGYVRLRLTPKPFETLLGYSLGPVTGAGGVPAAAREDEAAGTFLVGPLPPGPVTLRLRRSDAPDLAGWGHVTADVVVGKVTDVSLTPNPDDLDPLAVLSQSVGVGGGLTFRRPDGSFYVPTPAAPPPVNTVYLSDGVTPAWGAQSVVFLPGRYAGEQPERADALGRLQAGTLQLPYRQQQFSVPPTTAGGAEDPTAPTRIVWLPGTAGAAVLPYAPGQAQKIVLPPPTALTGRVTVGGKSPAGLPGALRVRAQYQGRGRLNDLLSVDVSAQPDGAFTLQGLTPGSYLVQAARDGIWLSASQTITVGDAPTPPLTLDIGPPGAPVVLRLAPGQAVTLDRPAGPLADLLWPASVHAGGAGDLRLDGLEAGRHAVRPAGGGPEIAFDVPAAGPHPASGTPPP